MTVSSYEAPYQDTPQSWGSHPHPHHHHQPAKHLHRRGIRSFLFSKRRRVFALVWLALAVLVLPGWLYFHLRAPHLDKRAIGRVNGARGRLPDHTWQQFAARRRLELKASGQRVLGALPEKDAYLARAMAGPFPIKLKYPILWCGALFSKSGYGTEAVSYVASLLQLGLVAPEDVWVSQSGDHIHDEVLQTMDPGLLRLLQDHHYHNMTQRLPPDEANRPLVAVCHSFPDCWRIPADDSHRITIKKVFKGIGRFVKHTVLGFKYEDSGCPCPHDDIQDQVVYRIGRTMFETEKLPRPLAAYAQFVDEVWVPSEFNRFSFAASGIELPKLHTLAEGINTTLFSPLLQPALDLKQFVGDLVAGTAYTGDDSGSQQRHRRHIQAAPSVLDHLFNVQQPEPEEEEDGLFRFLSVFKWERRKGWDILMRTYVQEFMGEPNVELHILTKETFEKVNDFPSYFRRMVAPVLNITHVSDWSRLPRVYLHYRHVPETIYPGLYQAMDALVIPTHGEGWGRPQIEAMSMGLPVISTNWSGLTAFMSEDIAYPIRISGVVPVQDEGPNSFEWFEGQRWAQPDEQHLRHLMRTVFSDRRAARRKGRAARQRILKEFSELAVARQLLAQVLRVQDTVEMILWGGNGEAEGGQRQQGDGDGPDVGRRAQVNKRVQR